MKKMMKNKHYCLLPVALLMILLQVSCGKQGDKNVTVTFVIGDVKLLRDGKEAGPLKLKDILKKGDTVETGEMSEAALQVGTRAVILVNSNSTLTIDTILEKNKDEFFVEKGRAVTTVKKLGRDSEFLMRSNNAFAAVRGTTFSVNAKENVTEIAVDEGNVYVMNIEAEDEKSVEPGKTAVISDIVEMRDVNTLEKLHFDKLKYVPLMDDVGTVSVENLKKKNEIYRESTKKVNEKIEQLSPMTLDQIRKKYGRIDVVTLYNGRTIRGAIISRGATLTMITPGGRVAVPKVKVKNTSVSL